MKKKNCGTRNWRQPIWESINPASARSIYSATPISGCHLVRATIARHSLTVQHNDQPTRQEFHSQKRLSTSILMLLLLDSSPSATQCATHNSLERCRKGEMYDSKGVSREFSRIFARRAWRTKLSPTGAPVAAALSCFALERKGRAGERFHWLRMLDDGR